MFIFNLTYIKSLAEVDKFLQEHRDYLDENYEKGNFVCSGRKNPRIGGVILCNCKTLEEARNIMEKDPFYREQIASYEIIEFNPTKFAKGLEKLLVN